MTETMTMTMTMTRLCMYSYFDSQTIAYLDEVGVKKTTELASSDDPQLINGLVDKTIDHARKAVLDTQRTSGITNEPRRFSRASALRGILDGMSVVDDGDTDAAASVADCRAGTGSVPKSTHLGNIGLPQPVPATGAGESESAGTGTPLMELPDMSSVLNSFRAPTAKTGDAAAGGKKKTPKGGKENSRKRLNDQISPDDDEVDAKKPKTRLVESMQPPDQTKAVLQTARASGTTVAESLFAGDKEWIETNMAQFREIVSICPEDEEVVKACFNDKLKSVNSMLKAVGTRIRSVRRRTPENLGTSVVDAEDLKTKLEMTHDLLKLLMKKSQGDCGNSGDECYSKLLVLEECGATFNLLVYQMVGRMMFFDDYRWKRWKNMNDVTYKFVMRSMPSESSVNFIVQNLNVLYQKLLKAVEEVSWMLAHSIIVHNLLI